MSHAPNDESSLFGRALTHIGDAGHDIYGLWKNAKIESKIGIIALPCVMTFGGLEAESTHMPIDATQNTIRAYERIFDGEIKPTFPQDAGHLIVKSSQLVKVQGYE
jgi:hypothetical protein